MELVRGYLKFKLRPQLVGKHSYVPPESLGEVLAAGLLFLWVLNCLDDVSKMLLNFQY